jgi:hypothetical protein
MEIVFDHLGKNNNDNWSLVNNTNPFVLPINNGDCFQLATNGPLKIIFGLLEINHFQSSRIILVKKLKMIKSFQSPIWTT